MILGWFALAPVVAAIYVTVQMRLKRQREQRVEAAMDQRRTSVQKFTGYDPALQDTATRKWATQSKTGKKLHQPDTTQQEVA
jgi:hypothetical protein